MNSDPRTSAGLIGVVLALMFAFIMTYDIVKKIVQRLLNGKDSSDHTSIDLCFMIYTNLFIILIHIAFITFNFVFSSTDIECEYVTKLCLFVFHLNRSILYLIFIRRIQIIYTDTMFALSKLHIYLLYILISTYSIPYLVYLNWYAFSTKYHVTFGCLLQYKSLLLIYLYIISILHILIAIYCLYLFVYPLYRLIHAQEDNQISYKLYNVMIKYSILYSSSIFSSFILIIISYQLPFGYNYSIIDNLINGLILILLHPIHNTIYKSLCCLLHSFCIIICNASKYDDEHRRSTMSYRIKSVETKTIEPTQCVNEDVMSNCSPTETSVADTNKVSITSSNTIRNIMKERVQQKFDNDVGDGSLPSPTDTLSDNVSDTDIVITVEDEYGTKNKLDLTLNITNTLSLRSFASLETVQFDNKKSNTLELIKYESTKL